MIFKARKPTHRLSVKTRQGAEPSGQGNIGVGWLEADGSMTVRLNPCVTLCFADNVLIKLFPVEQERQLREDRDHDNRADASSIDDRDIPF